jgi:hypothetical protein
LELNKNRGWVALGVGALVGAVLLALKSSATSRTSR